MKNNATKLGALVMVILTLLNVNCERCFAWPLFGGEKPVRNETGILDDILCSDGNFVKYRVEPDHMEIEKRMTDNDNRTDHIWIDITASNDHTVYTASYEMIYGLYNDGWILDDLLLIDEHIDARQPIPRDEADAKVASMGYVNFECVVQSGSAENGRVSFTYSAENSDGKKYNVGVVYSFIPSEGWVFFSAVGMSA